MPSGPIDESTYIINAYGWYRPAVRQLVGGKQQWVSQYEPLGMTVGPMDWPVLRRILPAFKRMADMNWAKVLTNDR